MSKTEPNELMGAVLHLLRNVRHILDDGLRLRELQYTREAWQQQFEHPHRGRKAILRTFTGEPHRMVRGFQERDCFEVHRRGIAAYIFEKIEATATWKNTSGVRGYLKRSFLANAGLDTRIRHLCLRNLTAQ